MSEFTVFHIEGGIGKHISSTAVIECYKKQNIDTKIIVVCAWPEIFLNNPLIYRVYRIGNTPYFYQEFIHNKDTVIFAQEPYKTTDHIKKKKTLIENWCNMIGVDYDGSYPRLHFNFREDELGAQVFQNNTNKPVLIFQPFGGPGKEFQETPYSWTRDIHPLIAQQLVDILSEKYFVIHVCYDFHPILRNCIRIDKVLSKKVLFSMLKQSDARLFIDSSLQHAAAAMNLPSTVVWVATQPEVFGYNIHSNITPEMEYSEGMADSYLYDYNFTGTIHECPYKNPLEIFSVQKITNSLL